MASIQVQDVTKAYGQKRLFQEVVVTFNDGRRYGMTGPNGSGKSTFMKIIAGDLEPDTGTVSRPPRTSVLKQDQSLYDKERVVDVVMMGNARLWQTIVEKDGLLARESISDEDGTRLGELECVIAEEDGYTAESDAGELLSGLGIVESFHDGKMSSLPGGLKLRVLLAQALFGNPDALLLDEPTNNLDIDSIRWLERFLKGYRGVLLTISHDRRFLNEICTHIADIDYNTIILYPGGYDDMVQAKGEVRGRVEKDNSERKKKVDQLQDFVARFHAGTRASQVQSRKRQIERLTLMDLKRSNIERPFIQFLVKKPSGKQTLTLETVTKRFGETVICENLSTVITKGDKVAIIGKSGVGKTSLCKLLLEELAPDSGKVVWANGVTLGNLAQEHRGSIRNGTTVTEWLHSFDVNATLQDVRGLLGRMLFRGEEGMKPTDALSGGEAVRLIFAKLMLMKDNVLVMDEPTNHLDLESIVALGDALAKYEGTAFVVTHDRDLVATFANRILAFTDQGLLDFRGTYDDFVEKFSEAEPGRKGASQRPASMPPLG